MFIILLHQIIQHLAPNSFPDCYHPLSKCGALTEQTGGSHTRNPVFHPVSSGLSYKLTLFHPIFRAFPPSIHNYHETPGTNFPRYSPQKSSHHELHRRTRPQYPTESKTLRPRFELEGNAILLLLHFPPRLKPIFAHPLNLALLYPLVQTPVVELRRPRYGKESFHALLA